VNTPEKDFQKTVIEYAEHRGWKTSHHRPGFARAGKFVTLASPGFPDLVLARDRLVFMELKAKGLKLRPEQQEWFEALRHAGVECYVVNPQSWALIEKVLD
jgi:VRR-NUC domain